MTEQEYVIFCDESDKQGKFYSNFYGGLIVGMSQYQKVSERLNQKKQALNLFGEIKWEKVTERYLEKYQNLILAFFEEIHSHKVKARIMFRQNAHHPTGLTQEDLDLQYFKLYYQFIKHGFGLKFIAPIPQGTKIRLYFDQFPDTRERVEQFKGYLMALQQNSMLMNAKIKIQKEDITEIKSHDHVLAQCLDVVLGSINFRLNDKHLAKNQLGRRGKRTIAKEILYKTILSEIKKIHPGFNIGISTGLKGNPEEGWNSPYLHWNFLPNLRKFESKLTKRGREL